MLSTRFGYRRPARFADAFAFALLVLLNFVCRLLRGADFFQGGLLFLAISDESRPVLLRDVAFDRTKRDRIEGRDGLRLETRPITVS